MRYTLNKYNIITVVLAVFFANSLFSQAPAILLHEKAKASMAKFEYFEAVGFLQKALKENPFFIEAQILLGDAYYAMDNFTAAWGVYLSAEKKDPHNPDLLVKLAKTKLQTAKDRESILATEHYLKKAFTISPRNTSVSVLYGEFYMKLEDYPKAMNFYNTLGNAVDNTQIYVNKAKIYSYWGQEEKALEELKIAEKIDSKDYLVLLEMGKIYSALNEYTKALIYLNASYSYNQKYKPTLLALADLYIKENNFLEASHKISQLILDDTTNPLLYYNLALCYEQLGNFAKAVEVLEQGLKYDYGNEFLRIKAEELIIQKLPLSSSYRKTFAQFYNTEAHNLIKDNKQEEALFFLKRSLHIDPLDIDTRISIANIYRKKSYLYEYLELLKGGVFLAPQNIQLQDQLKLNQKFIMNSLEHKEQITPNPIVPLEPFIKIGSIRVDGESYRLFTENARSILLESLINSHSINAFIDDTGIDRFAHFSIQVVLKPSDKKLVTDIEVIYLPTSNTYLKYSISEYGNNRLLDTFLRLAKLLDKDMPKIGHILKVDGNIAIINMGAQQGIKLGQKMKILNNIDLPGKFFSTQVIDPLWEIASAKVIELGENISKIQFKPLDRIVFNTVQQNQSLIIQQTAKAKNDSKKNN